VICQNVLEHIDDDAAAVNAMAGALAPGGRLVLLVPAHPRLYGRLDLAYGHHRRYTKERLRALAQGAGLDVGRLHFFNAAAAPGWWLTSHRGGRENIGDTSLNAFERLVPLLARIEERRRPPFGLSLVMHATRGETG
jgi:SAM-dependent methyltransferase